MLHVFLCVGLIISSWAYFSPEKAKAESNEPGTYLAAEDWDIGTPPPDFPKSVGSSWRGWTTKSYYRQYGHESGLSTTIYYTPPRAFRMVRSANQHGAKDIAYNLQQAQRKVHIRMYLYFGRGLMDAGSGGREDSIHFLFFNTSVGGTSFGVNISNWNDWDRTWPPNCSGPNDLYFQFHSYYNVCSGPCSKIEVTRGSLSPDCWNIVDHLEEWFSVEFMWDMDTQKAMMWINGVLKADRTICACNHTNINKIILSFWNSCPTCISNTHEVYIDNIVIDNKYIGPIIGDRPHASQNLKTIN